MVLAGLAAAVTAHVGEQTRSADTLEPGGLTVCLAEDGGVLSSRHGAKGAGFNHAVAGLVARRVDLPLKAVWYEAGREEETSPSRDARALPSHGVCDLVPDFPLYETALDPCKGAQMRRAALPQYDGRAPGLAPDHHVNLAPIAVSAPIRRASLGVVLHPDHAAHEVAKVADLDGLALGVEQGTLAPVAQAAHVTYAAPVEPIVQPRLTMKEAAERR